MGIDVRVENKRGDIFGRVADPNGYMNWILGLCQSERTTCARFIDPYGVTLFNSGQVIELKSDLGTVRRLITEAWLESEKRNYLDRTNAWPEAATADAATYVRSISVESLRAYVDQVLTLIDDALARGPHHYLRFLGD